MESKFSVTRRKEQFSVELHIHVIKQDKLEEDTRSKTYEDNELHRIDQTERCSWQRGGN